MPDSIQFIGFNRMAMKKNDIEFLGAAAAEKAQRFHRSFPDYSPTPLAVLNNLAGEIGIGKLFVKDESFRFGLNAFKALGGSYAIGSYLANRMSMDIDDLPYSKMVSDETHEKLGEITFVTATDGNHGRGVAWTANRLRQKSVVYMPKGSAEFRLRNIQAEGSDASITNLNYDDAVRFAADNSIKNGWALIQDTAWDGYEKIPKWIMQGYCTMALEADKQMKQLNEKPTHIFLQAGVGSMAASVLGYFANVYGDERPIAVIVEPEKANCVFRSAKANDGKRRFVTDDMDTIMAGLACGEPSKTGWPVLRDYADGFISCSDTLTANCMRVLSSPLGNDPRIISGESGAAGVGVLAEIMKKSEYAQLKKQLKLNGKSKVICFSTEGDTDPENYKRIVWDGAFSDA